MTHYSPREQEILHLVADLRTRDELHPILGCTQNTLSHHLCTIYEKAEVHSYVELIRYALEHGHGCRYQICLDTCPVETAIAKRKKQQSKPKLIVTRVYMQKHTKRLVVERKPIDG